MHSPVPETSHFYVVSTQPSEPRSATRHDHSFSSLLRVRNDRDAIFPPFPTPEIVAESLLPSPYPFPTWVERTPLDGHPHAPPPRLLGGGVGGRRTMPLPSFPLSSVAKNPPFPFCYPPISPFLYFLKAKKNRDVSIFFERVDGRSQERGSLSRFGKNEMKRFFSHRLHSFVPFLLSLRLCYQGQIVTKGTESIFGRICRGETASGTALLPAILRKVR